MCCCGKPTRNGELGYRWQPEHAPSAYPVNAPELAEGETMLFDEPGRCGGIDSHSHHYRVVKWHSQYLLAVRHGGGVERIALRLYGNGQKEMLASLDSNARYWLLNEIHSVYREAERAGQQKEGARWHKAAVEKRIKTRKMPNRDQVKVWIE